MDHFLLLAWHAFLVSVFFAFLWRSGRKQRWALFWKMFVIMIAGAVALAWLMYPVP